MSGSSENSNVKNNLGRALRLMLKPLAKLLIDQGITHQEFSEAAKEAYVEMALRSQLEQTGKINRSRVAIVTGLTRKEVAAVLARALDEETHPRTFSRPGKVLHGWHNDPDYVGPYGMPMEIPYEPPSDEPTKPSFVSLVKVYGGDQSAMQMLEELTRVGAIMETAPSHYKPLRRDFEPDRLSPKLIERFGEVTYEVMTTLSFNVQKDEVGAGRFDRRVFSVVKLNEEEVHLFSQYLRVAGQAFLETVDNWLNTTITPKPPNYNKPLFDSGMAMIHYWVENSDEKKTLREFLIEMGLDEKRGRRVVDVASNNGQASSEDNQTEEQ